MRSEIENEKRARSCGRAADDMKARPSNSSQGRAGECCDAAWRQLLSISTSSDEPHIVVMSNASAERSSSRQDRADHRSAAPLADWPASSHEVDEGILCKGTSRFVLRGQASHGQVPCSRFCSALFYKV